MNYQVVEGEQPFVTLCAVLYYGELGRDLTVLLTILNSSQGDTGLFYTIKVASNTLCFYILLAVTGRDYIMDSQTLIFTYDEMHNKSSTPCVNVTILDDEIPENEQFITIGLSVTLHDSSDVFIATGKNQTVISILDDDHGNAINISVHHKDVWQ